MAAEKQEKGPILIVGLGASAGGLEAFQQFFDHMPPGSNMAFVLVQHRTPDQPSMLGELIARHTSIPVVEARDGTEVQANHVYVAPAQQNLELNHGQLQFFETEERTGQRTPINFFFRSLARDQGAHAAGIVLSGMGTEGTLGVRAIKEAGGLVLVQDEESAQYESMPCSAAATHLADFILPPAQMPERLLAYAQHLPLPPPAAKAAEPPSAKKEDHLQTICRMLREYTGHDFSQYKPNTLHRRIERQRIVHQFEGLDEYVRFLQQDPQEVEQLFRELLVAVTSFFRDPEAFVVLSEKVLAPLLASRSSRPPLRVWVPGCATGEEAYSIAMLLAEQMEGLEREFLVEIFATDIEAEAIRAARQGMYPEGLEADVSTERLKRFFVREDHVYRIKEEIRERVIFAEQSIIKDPPFSRLDLISCRNLLIYLNGDLQKKVLPLFHYALKPGGYLLLGSSETIGEATDLFIPLDRKWKLFQHREKEGVARPLEYQLPENPAAGSQDRTESRPFPALDSQKLTENALLAHYHPVGILVDAHNRVLYIHGRSGQFLELPAGNASLDVTDMARKGLKPVLAAALRQARAEKAEVRHRRMKVRTNGGEVAIDLTVRPAQREPARPDLMLIVLEEVAGQPEEEGVPSLPSSEVETQRIAELERELQASREYLQSTIEELETTNEEYRSANEELQSANEELQSTNEELQTAKEEQQSVNEELATVNNELESKVEELSSAKNDMQNLLDSIEVGTIFLDLELKIKRFTATAIRLVNLIASDVGRPLAHLVWNVEYDALVEDAQQVLDTLVPEEREVRSRDGDWYLVRIRPYRTAESVIEGVVITFIDITQQKEIQQQLEEMEQQAKEAQAFAENIVETVPHPLVVLDAKLCMVSANRAFYQTFQEKPESAEGQLIYELGDGEWNISRLRELLEDILPGQSSFENFEMAHDFPRIGRRNLRLNGREVWQEKTEERLILLVIEVDEKDG